MAGRMRDFGRLVPPHPPSCGYYTVVGGRYIPSEMGEMLKLTKKKGNTITPRRYNNLNGYRRRETTQIH